MNIRIEGNDIRFKVSRIELESLDRGDVLKQSTSLDADKFFDLHIVSKILANGALELQTDSSLWTLFIDMEAIKGQISSKPTRKGVSVQQGSLNLTLQVDIRRSSEHPY